MGPTVSGAPVRAFGAAVYLWLRRERGGLVVAPLPGISTAQEPGQLLDVRTAARSVGSVLDGTLQRASHAVARVWRPPRCSGYTNHIVVFDQQTATGSPSGSCALPASPSASRAPRSVENGCDITPQKSLTTLCGGSLGSCVDEERSQLRELM